MHRSFVTCGGLAALTLLAWQGVAQAEDQRAVMVEYVAPPPPECPSLQVLQKLVTEAVAVNPVDHRDWRFKVLVRRVHDEYVGALTSETGASSAHSCDCRDVAVEFARIIAGGQADAHVAPPAPSEPGVPAPPPPAEIPPPLPVKGPAVWRLGATLQTWSHGANAYDGPATAKNAPAVGFMGGLSVEVPGGFNKMMFEAALGVMGSSATASPSPCLPNGPCDNITVPSYAVHLTYYVLDMQACPIDLPLGAGFSALGCVRLALATFDYENPGSNTAYPDQMSNSGGALWFGGGGRLRWQSPFSLFAEAHLNAVYGTVSSGENPNPAWGDFGVQVGFRL
jgi:hypothetical protein